MDGPLLITGMHRSGTSATARLLHLAGLDLGQRLMAPRLDNPLGYYEDLEFVGLNVELVDAGVGADPRHRPSWAFPEELVGSRLEPLRPRVERLIEQRRAGRRPWGFKDPRTTILLDFYDELAPDARYLFVYRSPWEVVDSLMRAVERPLHGRADRAVVAWIAYNERILAFCQRHPERTGLMHVDALAQRPDAVLELARRLTPAALPTPDAGAAFVERLMTRSDRESPLVELLTADHPRAIEVYGLLEASADLPSVHPSPNGAAPVVDVRPGWGKIALGAAAIGVEPGSLRDAANLAAVPPGHEPRAAADAAVDRLDDELVVVAFDGRPRRDAVVEAAAALRLDPELGAVLLAAGAAAAATEADPLTTIDRGAAIVLRRRTWLDVRGFGASDAPPGFEAWMFTVGCQARGVRTARRPGAIDATAAAGGEDDARRRALESYPRLAARVALDVGDRLSALEREHDRTVDLLNEVLTTRAWRSAVQLYRVRDRLRRGR